MGEVEKHDVKFIPRKKAFLKGIEKPVTVMHTCNSST